jgi:hypothetical protein
MDDISEQEAGGNHSVETEACLPIAAIPRGSRVSTDFSDLQDFHITHRMAPCASQPKLDPAFGQCEKPHSPDFAPSHFLIVDEIKRSSRDAGMMIQINFLTATKMTCRFIAVLENVCHE